MFSLSLLASNWYLGVSRPGIMVKGQNRTHTHSSPSSSTVADPFSRTASLSSVLTPPSPGHHSTFCLDLDEDFAGRCCKVYPLLLCFDNPLSNFPQPLSNIMNLLLIHQRVCSVPWSILRAGTRSYTCQVCRRTSRCFLPCSLPVSAKAPLRSALRSIFIVTRISHPS